MSARANMRHRCTVQRRLAGGPRNAWNSPGDAAWADHLTDEPCFFWMTGSHRSIQAGSDVVVQDSALLMRRSADVTDQDQIAHVSDRLGNVIVEGPFVIDAVDTRADHKRVMLKGLS